MISIKIYKVHAKTKSLSIAKKIGFLSLHQLHNVISKD